MSDSRYSYDDGAEVWPYFVATIVGSVVIPTTISRIFSSGSDKSTLPPQLGEQNVTNGTTQAAYRKRANKRSIISWSTIFLLAGWALLGLLVYVIIKSQSDAPEVKAYDPFEILDIVASATSKEIKSAYRKLSLQFHPDKFKPDEQFTLEWAEARYIDITKAYKALTDDETRENFLKYGHPDGPQQSSHGIALPSFLVNTASPLVMGLYAALIGLVLPYTVGKWWAKQKAVTRAGIFQETASKFFVYCLKENVMFTTSARLLDLLADTAEMRIAAPNMSPEQVKEALENQLNRKDEDGDLETNIASIAVVVEAVRLLDQMVSIAAEFKHVVLLRRIIDLQRALVQGVPLDQLANGSVLQLPKTKLRMSKEKAKELLKNLPQSAAAVAKTIPQMHILRADFKMPGSLDNKLAPSSTPVLEIEYVIGALGQPAPHVDLEAMDAINAAASTDIDVKALHNPVYTNFLPPALPSAYAPRYPLGLQTKWQVLLVNERDNKIIHVPMAMVNADLSNLNLTAEQLKSGDGVVTGKFKVQLAAQAPNFPGEFPFSLQMLNTTYFGCDGICRAIMKVVPESEFKVEVIEDEEEEEEEQTKDDEEEEDEDDLSDIDTDTDEES